MKSKACILLGLITLISSYSIMPDFSFFWLSVKNGAPLSALVDSCAVGSFIILILASIFLMKEKRISVLLLAIAVFLQAAMGMLMYLPFPDAIFPRDWSYYAFVLYGIVLITIASTLTEKGMKKGTFRYCYN